MVAAVNWPLLWAVQLATNAQLEAEAQFRKLEDELKLREQHAVFYYSTSSGLADKVEEQNNSLETLACHFAKLGEHMLLQIKVQVLVTKSE